VPSLWIVGASREAALDVAAPIECRITITLSCVACCRSDEDDPSGSKYSRMEEDSIQDKERFARWVARQITDVLGTYVQFIFTGSSCRILCSGLSPRKYMAVGWTEGAWEMVPEGKREILTSERRIWHDEQLHSVYFWKGTDGLYITLSFTRFLVYAHNFVFQTKQHFGNWFIRVLRWKGDKHFLSGASEYLAFHTCIWRREQVQFPNHRRPSGSSGTADPRQLELRVTVVPVAHSVSILV
jgi:hypothetical protein